MFIKSINIEQFAGIKNKSFTLENGFNILSGKNECGKTSLCAFIKYVLYGFDDSKEKERYLPIDSGIAFGYLTLEKDGRTYRIERRQTARTQTVNIYDDESGDEISEWKSHAETPGEFFTSVPASLYPRSLYVTQDIGARLDGGSAEAVSNLLLSGDEAVNLKRAKRLLDLTRKELKLKKGQGGLIYETESRLTALKNEKARGLASKKEYEALMTELQKENAEISALNAQLEKARASSKRAKMQKIKMYLDNLTSAKSALHSALNKKTQLQEHYSHNGFLPDSEFEKSLIAAQNELDIYSKQVRSLKDRIDEAQKQMMLTTPKGYEEYSKVKDKAALAESVSFLSGIAKLCRIVTVSSMLILAVSLLAAVAGAVGLLTSSVPLLAIFAVISVLAALTSFALRFVFSKKLKALISPFKTDKTRSFDAAVAEFEEYEGRAADDTGYLAKSLEDAANAQEKADEKLKNLLCSWGKTDGKSALSELRSYLDEAEALSADIRTFQSKVSVLNAYLEQFNQNEIEEAKSAPITVKTEISEATEADISELERRLENAKARLSETELALASNAAFAIDMEKNAYESELCQAELAKYYESHSALMLAYDALEDAEKNIRNTVSPYLSKSASRYFSAVTDGRYDGVRVDSEMALSYTAAESVAQTDGKYLSGGSLDLAWFTLRLALHDRLSENGCIPLILDEAFVYFDDDRLSSVLAILSDKAELGTQILLFTASSREIALMPNCPYTAVEL